MAFVKSRYSSGELEGLTSSEKLSKLSVAWTELDDEGRKVWLKSIVMVKYLYVY
jgi:hypothetical protein